MNPTHEPSTHSGLSWSRARLPLVALSVAVVGIAAGKVISSGSSREATIPAGTRLVAALEHTVSTENAVGRSVELKTESPVSIAKDVTIPAGMIIRGEVTHAQGGGRIAGSPDLTLRFTKLEIDGNSYDIVADPWRVRGKSDLGESVAEIGGGTVIGAVVGGLKGAVIGGAIGTGVAVATKGNQIVLPAGQDLRIRLAEPVTVRYRPKERERT
jgi:hypothetical protein